MALRPPDLDSLPDLIGGRYRVLKEIGRGGMGVVYEVEHIHTGDHLALKLLLGHAGADPATVERFKREARAPARIKSENVVKITDADVAHELSGAPFMVMELLEGESLDARLERGAMSKQETVNILVQLARALDKAHRLGIVHRDLKPENLFLHKSENGGTVLKILDFGISKFTAEAGGMDSANMTSTGTIMGTPLYMAPEQARGLTAQIGPPTDIWAVGLIAFHMLAGHVYWTATGMTELIVKIVVEPLAPPSAVNNQFSAEFDAWFMRSCDRNADARWNSIAVQIAALAEIFGCAHVARDVTNATIGGIAPTAPLPVPPAPRLEGTMSSNPGWPTQTAVSLPTGRERARRPVKSARWIAGGLGVAMLIILAIALTRNHGPDPARAAGAPVVAATTAPVDTIKASPAAEEYQPAAALDAGTATAANAPTPTAREAKLSTATVTAKSLHPTKPSIKKPTSAVYDPAAP